MKKTLHLIAILAMVSFLTSSCEKDRSLNFFSVQQDIDFGETLKEQIESDRNEYPILDRNSNREAYAYLEGMMAEILKSDKLKFADRFQWEITIIDKDVLNAFAAPGGKLFFYTGLMKYLDDGASLAGVLGHEMAHADLRHSTSQMTKTYSFTTLLAILAGNDQTAMEKLLGDLAAGLGALKFSRDNEHDADKYSMYYLATTSSNYNPKGISSFFIKMMEGDTSSNPIPWLSTHPSDQKRVEEVNSVWSSDKDFLELRGNKNEGDYSNEKSNYEHFKSLLP